MDVAVTVEWRVKDKEDEKIREISGRQNGNTDIMEYKSEGYTNHCGNTGRNFNEL